MIKKIDLGAAMGGFAQAGDAGFVYGEMANGAQVKIKKADLLSTLFQDKWDYSGDVNDLKTPGMYYTTGNTINANGITGLFLVFRSGNAILQISTGIFNNKILYRTKLYNNGAWNIWASWKQISVI